MASRNGVKFSPELERVGLASRAPKASQDALKIMFSCLLWDPLKRCVAAPFHTLENVLTDTPH